MFYFIEAIFIGLYTFILSSLLNLIVNFNIQLFLTGFIKHLSGYYIGLHYYYCNNNNFYNNNFYNNKYSYKNDYLLSQSIYEGILFILIGNILNYYISNQKFIYFGIGFLLHIISEKIGYHKYFINNYCIKNS